MPFPVMLTLTVGRLLFLWPLQGRETRDSQEESDNNRLIFQLAPSQDLTAFTQVPKLYSSP